jgi:hypothetical protein
VSIIYYGASENVANSSVCLPLGFNEKGQPLLKPVEPENDAWDDLQLPGGVDGHKHIVQSLIKKHFAKDMAIDLVRDKGQCCYFRWHLNPLYMCTANFPRPRVNNSTPWGSRCG